MDLAQSKLFSSDSDKPPLHLYSANGFPVGVYQPIFEQLSEHFNVGALANRATWQPNVSMPKNRCWQVYADDLINFIEQQGTGPVIGVGHSLGATCTVYAAQKRPDLFSKLVLIEPAMVSRPLASLIKMTPKRLMKKVNPAKGTLNKNDVFSSRQEYLDYIKKFQGYAQFSPQMFDLFAEHAIFRDTDGKFRLKFSKHWEAHNYTGPPHVLNRIAKLQMPVVAIRGKPNLFFSKDFWTQWKKAQPQATFLESLDNGHLLPLENPTYCSELIIKGVKSALPSS